METTELAQKTVNALRSGAPSLVRELIASTLQGEAVAAGAWNDFVKTPNDEDTVAALRKELKKLFAADANFTLQVATLVAQVNQVSAGEGGVAVGGDVHGNIVIGNNNTLVEKQITKNQSGGVSIEGEEVNISGDVVGRDKK